MLAQSAGKGDMQMSNKIVVPVTENAELRQKITEWVHLKFGSDPTYDLAQQPLIEQFGLPWFRAAALVVDANGKILLGHEGRINIDKVKDPDFKAWLIETNRCDSEGWANGDGGWNIPAGRLACGETFEQGVLREIREETGHEVELLGIIHIRWGKKYVMPTYLARDVSGPSQYRTEDSNEILGIGSFSVEGIRALNDAGILRSPESVMGSLNAYEAYSRGEKRLNEINGWDE